VPFSDVADGVLSRVPTMKLARRLNVEWKYRAVPVAEPNQGFVAVKFCVL
jgi:hypothetical protein